MTLYFLLQGLLLGLSAGFAPGPLLALVVAETLDKGSREGIKVALAPVFTDLPIIAAAMFLLAALSSYRPVLGAISVGGAIFVFSLGLKYLRLSGADAEDRGRPSRALARGIAVNLLSPHPYLFWISVGGPITRKALAGGLLPAAAFIGSFYLLLVGSKIALAVAVGRSRDVLKGRGYLLVMRILGGLLCGLALILLRDGMRLLAALSQG